MRKCVDAIILMMLWVGLIPLRLFLSLLFWGKCLYTCWKEDRLSDMLDVYKSYWGNRFDCMCKIMDEDFYVEEEEEA